MGPSKRIQTAVAGLVLLGAFAVPAAQSEKPGVGPDEGAAAPSLDRAPAGGGAGPPCRGVGVELERLSLVEARASLLCLVDRERRDRRLPGFREAPGLQRSADRHARDMVRRGYFAHTYGRSTLKSRVTRAGYLRGTKAYALGEALAYGSSVQSTTDLLAAMLASPAHRALIHRPRFREIGVGVARGMPDGDGGLTVTLDFAVRR